MRYSAKLLSLATLTALLIPALEVATAAAQNPGFFEETGVLQATDISQTAPPEEAATVLLEVEGVLEQGDNVFDDGRLFDGYSFEGQAGQSISIRLQSDEFDTALVLFRNDGEGGGELIAQNDNFSQSDTNSQVTTRLPVDGNYGVAVITSDITGRGRYQLMITEATAADVKKAEADRLLQQGITEVSVSQFREALQSFEQALAIYREIDDRRGEGNALGNSGGAYGSLGQYERAINLFEQQLVITREIGDRSGEGAALNNLGLVYNYLDQYEWAIDFHEQALSITREIGDRSGEGAALNNLGLVYNNLSRYKQAIDFHEQALVITREIGDRAGEGRALGNLGIAHHSLAQYEQAIDLFEQRLAIAQEIGDRAGKGNALGNLGNAYFSLGQYGQAINLFEQQLAITRGIGDRSGEGNALGSLGNVYDSQGQYERAIDLYELHLSIAREIGERSSEGTALGNLGLTYADLGQYERAINLFEQQLAVAREIGNRSGEGTALGNLGLTYADLGQYKRAIDLYEQALTLFRELGSRAKEGKTLGNLGTAYRNLGQYERAINLFEQRLAIAREIGDRAGEGAVLGNAGNVYYQLTQYEQAIDLYELHLAIAREIGNRSGEGTALGNLGNAYAALDQYEQAIDFYEQRLAIARDIGDRAGEGIALNNKGNFLIDTEQLTQAEASLYQSIEVYESLRTNLSDDQLISIADTQAQAYANLELALTAQNKTAEALAITERGRGRAFVLQLASRLATEEERAALEAGPVAQVPTVAEIQQIARDTQTTLVTYSLIFDQALYIWVVQPSGEIEFREVEFEGSDGGGPIINPIASIDGPVYRSASHDSALTALVTDSRSAVNESGNPNTPQLQELHEVLIDPIADLLPSDPNAQVAFIPQGELFLVPFAALQDDDGTYLIEKHTILTAPSIQVFGLANESVGAQGLAPLPTNNALIVGNPTMPSVWLPNDDGDFAETQLSYLSGAETEAEAIGEFFNISVLTGDQATEARIKQALPNASLIHLATHGLLEYGIPESSGVLDVPGAVALAPGNGEDGLLTSAEILAMDLQADLAVLSACDTGRGRITGDGVVGLSRALITAGVPSVMVSLWAVNDASTSVLMQRFYEILATGEFTKAEALRQAQLSLLYAEDVETRLEAVRAGAAPTFREGFEPVGDRHPYHWAPFVLIGNGQ